VADEEQVAPRRMRQARNGGGREEQHAPPAADRDEENDEQDRPRRRPAGGPPAGSGPRRRSASATDRDDAPGSCERPAPAIRAAAAARLAAENVAEFTGREPENVVAIDRRDGDWYVDVEVVESHRIPDTTDVLAIYEVRLDRGGDLLSYRRTRRYARGQLDKEYR
jgi:Gas vesicle synthesis protein GvpO